MLPTRLLLSFVGFCLCSISREYDGCEYQVKVSIKKFAIENSTWSCSWPGPYRLSTYQACTITAAILPKSTNQVNATLLPDATVAPTLTTKFPAVNGSFPGIKLEFHTSSWSEKDVCVINTDDAHYMYGSSVPYYMKIMDPESGRKHCSANLNVTSTLHCPATSKQETITVTITSTTEPNVALFNTSIMMTSLTSGLMQSTSGTKEKSQLQATSKMWIWNIIMSIAYFAAGVTISVEVVYCCRMYRRSKSFPWCKVKRTKARNVENGLSNGSNKSVTIGVDKKPTPPPSTDPARKPASKSVWIKLDSQKEK